MSTKVLRIEGVRGKTGDSKSGLYASIAAGEFVPPIKIAARAAGWPEEEVDEINRARIAGFSRDQIRELVHRLVARRKAYAPKLAA